ncbi:MAG TPA: ABC transporter permease, partial [Methanocella sp.]
TPLSAIEWLVSRMIAGTIAALLSVAMALFLAYAFFGARSGISFTTVPLVIAGSVMAVGLGVVLACLVRDVQSAVSASFTVTLPLILVSGSLFPVSRLPWFLSAISAISPLTYLNDGLRGAMVPGSTAGAITDLAVVGLIGIILAGASLVIMRRGVR